MCAISTPPITCRRTCTVVIAGRLRRRARPPTWSTSTSAACRGRQGRCPATSRGAASQKEKRATVEEPWPLPAVVVAHHITYDGHPDAYPLHIASKVLSDGQSSRIYRKLVYETGLALTAFGRRQLHRAPEPLLRRGDRQPGPVAGRGGEGADRRVRSDEDRGHHASASCSGRRTSSRATTSSAANRPAEGHAPGARRGAARRHHHRRRRVRHLPEHHARPTCSAWRRPISRRRAAS